MTKKIIFLSLIVGAFIAQSFIAQSFAQDKIYVWEKSGNVTGYNVANIDSISFTGPGMSVSLNNNVIIQGNPVMVTIVDTYQSISSVDLFKDNLKMNTYTDFEQVGNNYYLTIPDLTSGAYTLVVNGNVTIKKDFTVISFSVPQYNTFTAVLGGASSSYGSYLSISKKTVYTLSVAVDNSQNVEVVFDGMSLFSPYHAANAEVRANGINTTFNNEYVNGSKVGISLGSKYNFETNTGLKGYITIDAVVIGTIGLSNAVISVTVAIEK